MSNGFILRLRTPQGLKRLNFSSDRDTLATLQAAIQKETGVAPADQLISTTPLSAPELIGGAPNITLANLKLKHGDMLYLVDTSPAPAVPPPASSSSAPAKPKPASASTPSATAALASGAAAATSAPKLTKWCTHGPRGRCLHCDATPAGSPAPKMPCSHGPGVTCPNCSEYVQSKAKQKDNEEVATWLCSHPETAFCPKCIPKQPLSGDEMKVALKCSCNKAKGQQCIHCMDQISSVKTNFLPYATFMKEKRAVCKFAHAPNLTCASCAPPKMEDYKGKENCDRGHKPWPYGVCLNCAPANAHLRLQKYRHCDYVTFEDLQTIRVFYSDWMKRGAESQRAGIIFGAYADEPTTEGAIRAQVHCIYEPPQEPLPKGVRFLRDPLEQTVHKVADALKIQPVGWIVATLQRSGAKYGGKVFLSGSEVKQAARFQNRYKDELGHSRFVTVVVEHSDKVAPQAYQVSDQCVALERDGVLAIAADPWMMATHVPQKGEIVPSVIYKDKPLAPGTEFLPDEFIVPVVVTQPEKPQPRFKHCDFKSGGSEGDVKAFFIRYAREEYHTKLSDFNLLVALVSVVGWELTEKVCKALLIGDRFSPALKNELDQAFTKKKLLP